MTAEQMLGSFPFLVGAACENVDIKKRKPPLPDKFGSKRWQCCPPISWAGDSRTLPAHKLGRR